MSKIKQTLPDDWQHDQRWSRPDQEQEDDRELVGPMSVVVPLLGELVALALFIACGFVWTGILSGRI
jgi:hypothetical protein